MVGNAFHKLIDALLHLYCLAFLSDQISLAIFL